MILRIAILAALAVIVVAVNLAYRRRSSASTADSPPVPGHLPSAGGSWVIFSTPMCVNCGTIAAQLRSTGHRAVHVIDVTVEPELGRLFEVRTAPTLLRVDGAGRILDRAGGPRASLELAQRFTQVPAV